MIKVIKYKKNYFLLILFFLSIFFQFNLIDKKFVFSKIKNCPWCEVRGELNQITFVPYKTFFLKILAPADTEFLADLLWLKTCYYFGYHSLTDKQYDYLFFLLDKITDLSPGWLHPYKFGIISLSSEADSYFEALIVADKGIEKFPDSWELLFFKGYILWQHFNDYENASEMFLQASQKKDAPKFLLPLSVSFAKKTGDYDLVNKFYEIALETIKDPLQREILIKKMKE